jgi:hypothetical protein
MVSEVRSHVRQNVVGYVALFVALGGTGAYAANEWNGSNIQDGTLTGADIQDLSLGLPDYGANSISTGKLKDQDVRTADLRDLNVTNPKIAWDSISSGKVIDNNLTGNDINEGTLAPVNRGFSSGTDPVPTNFIFESTTVSLTQTSRLSAWGDIGIEAVSCGGGTSCTPVFGLYVDGQPIPGSGRQVVVGGGLEWISFHGLTPALPPGDHNLGIGVGTFQGTVSGVSIFRGGLGAVAVAP